MAGILANSAEQTMVASSPDTTQAGYVTSSRITLSTTPTGAAYSWGLAKPAGATSRSNLSGTTDASPAFTPDVAGTWTVTADVDGTAYVIRLTVTAIAVTSVANGHRMSPVTDNSLPAPAKGLTLYCSSTAGDAIRVKDTSGNVRELVSVRTAGANLADADATVNVSAGGLRTLPAATLTVNRTLTLGTTGAYAGAEVTIVRRDTSVNTLQIDNGGGGGGTLTTLPAGQEWSITFRYDGTNWAILSAGQLP